MFVLAGSREGLDLQPRNAQGQWLAGADLIAWYREHFGDKTILSFSAGKDSITMAVALRGHVEMIPFYRVIVPGLEFVERSLSYYERHLFGGRPIIRVAHGIGWNAIVNQCDMSPAAAAHIGRQRLRYLRPEASEQIERELAGSDLPVAIGVRAADSVNRWLSMQHNGPFTASSRKWYPVWDMKRADQIALLKKSGIKLPIDYRIWGRSFDGVEYKYLAPLKKHFPRDFQKILEAFPLLEADFVRHERSYN